MPSPIGYRVVHRVALAASISAGIAAQAAPSSEDPPVVGVGAQLTLLAFLVVMLVVPWLMAVPPAAVPPEGTDADQGENRPHQGFFTSQRERRLWFWVAVVLLAIYATLSPMQVAAAELRERGLLGVTTGTALLLVALVGGLFWWRGRPGHREVGAGVGVLAVYVTTIVRLPVPEARSHLFEYGLVAVLIYHALLERRRGGRSVPIPALMAVVTTALLGWVDEGVQAFLPNRVYDLVDVGFNTVAATMAVLSSLVLGWARRLDLLRRIRPKS